MSQVPMRRLLVWRRHTLSLYHFPWGWRLRHIVWAKNDPTLFKIAHELTIGRPTSFDTPKDFL